MTDRRAELVDVFMLEPNAGSHYTSRQHDIFMITGNPGLISYYTGFLGSLYSKLERARPDVPFSVRGQSLGGFEASGDSFLAGKLKAPLSLQQQIDVAAATIFRHGELTGNNIILIGHSVGAYMLLEVLRRYNAMSKERQLSFQIVGGLCLFPTVVDIAQAPNGRRMGWLLRLPYFALAVSSLVRALTSIIPTSVFENLVQVVTRFPKGAAACTTAFLQSPSGVRQALHMARDEMNEITSDPWDEEIWGSASADPKRQPKLFFYFGTSDHWVADRTRENIIEARSQQPGTAEAWKPKMEIDTTGIPHGFCIRHSEPIARKCAEYIQEIISHTTHDKREVGSSRNNN